MNYDPRPIDVSDIVLPPELDGLMETLAKNVHEVWASNRLAQGWRLGKERSDGRKEHPCLIPYDQLPEVEKAYDRATAATTLKVILKSGFEIRKGSPA